MSCRRAVFTHKLKPGLTVMMRSTGLTILLLSCVFLSACGGGGGSGSTPPPPGSLTAPTGLTANAVSSSEISLAWDVVTAAASYVIYRNGQPVTTSTSNHFNDSGLFAGTSFSYQVASQDSAGAMSAPSSAVVAQTHTFAVNDVQVGDPLVSYANVEFTDDSRYMVWFEQSTDGSGLGTMWHCAVDPATGTLDPPDGKGFRAFDSSAWGRANAGIDAQGAFYVGMNRTGQLILVRPTSATTGTVTTLATAVDTLRRAIYPTNLPNATNYVFWIRNSTVAGAGYSPPGNTSFTLQYISLADPASVHDVETQPLPANGFAPMDAGFARWFRGKAALSFGSFDARGYVQVKEFDVDSPGTPPYFVTGDPSNKIDPWSMVFGDSELILPGINATATTTVYQRSSGETLFTSVEQITPPDSLLVNPALAQSNQSIVFDDLLYTTYQVNERGLGFYDTITNTGEIWLSTVLQSPPTESQWRLSNTSDVTVASLAKSEPEPYIGTSKTWVFYSAVPNGSNFTTSVWALRRADTPIGKR